MITQERQDLSDGEVISLVKSAQEGDMESLEFLYNAFEPLRSSVAKRLAFRGLDSEDAQQEVDMIFCVAIMNYDSSKDPSPKRHISSYTKNRARNFYQRQLRWLKGHLSYYEDLFQLESILTHYGLIDCYCETPEESIIESLDVAEILDRHFTPAQKSLMYLYYVSDLTQTEIANFIGKDQSIVSRRIRNIKNKFSEAR